MKTIVHMTCVHSRDDTRVFKKECRTLAFHGYRVFLVVADGRGDEVRDGVSILDVGKPSSRLRRMVSTTRRVYDRALSLGADLFHFHDPELLPIGVRLSRQGKKVVFDSHEDVPKQLLSKPYLHPMLLRGISLFFAAYERRACRRLSGIIAATPFISEKFKLINPVTLDVNNFPLIGELDSQIDWSEKNLEVCYVGGLSSIRGIGEVIEGLALAKSGVRLNLVGSFGEEALEERLKRQDGWSQVNRLGQLDRNEVRDVLSHSVAGLVTFHPLPNHIDAQPNKMFEYMSAGIPVIASNFPLWRQIIEGSQCGLCIDPMDPTEIASAMDFFISDPATARRMGENGRLAVLSRYNWDIESKKLISFYEQILQRA